MGNFGRYSRKWCNDFTARCQMATYSIHGISRGYCYLGSNPRWTERLLTAVERTFLAFEPILSCNTTLQHTRILTRTKNYFKIRFFDTRAGWWIDFEIFIVQKIAVISYCLRFVDLTHPKNRQLFTKKCYTYFPKDWSKPHHVNYKIIQKVEFKNDKSHAERFSND